ncbi:hypothetical protein BLA60_34525 [Actinophytocola xinjiangensis]|uniref:Uncharacterized protein n=1 Tax=Actinophytocola xinjiangensis TaxID=485602 RepID=A0A7Z1AUD0_9PSEU|nr:hypothetical protein [Actinophytocola xinjiangensis]OLF05897.1 hypothetical protein BLA60_34525 [Actinophytocola xinjiangensis]
MQSEVRAPDERPYGQVPEYDSNISVLAGGGAALRLGARVLPLRRWMSMRHSLVGAEIGVTASLLDQLPVRPAAVIVVAPEVDAAAVVDRLLSAAYGMLGSDTETDALTLGITSPEAVRSGTAGGLAMYNLHRESLPEALVEAVTAGRRCGLTTVRGNCVLLLQRFVPASASAVVHARPERDRPVRVDGRWGLTEASSPSDVFEVPPDGGAISERLAWKPTAHVVAHGGTHTVNLPAGLRYRYSLGRATVRQLAGLSRDAALTAGRPLSLDIAVTRTGPVVLRCRPAVG